MACNGNKNQTCGGPNGLTIFQFTGWYADSTSCWNDTVGRRTLNYQQYGLGNLSPWACTTACRKNGYTLAGLEYGNE